MAAGGGAEDLQPPAPRGQPGGEGTLLSSSDIYATGRMQRYSHQVSDALQKLRQDKGPTKKGMEVKEKRVEHAPRAGEQDASIESHDRVRVEGFSRKSILNVSSSSLSAH